MNPKQTKLSIVLILTALSGVLFYREAILQVANVVMHREGSSHGVFVPFISLYFLWLNLERLKAIAFRTDLPGATLMVAGLIPPILGIGTYHIQFIGFILLLAGLVWTILGRDMLKQVAFPLFFLITMVPIPMDAYIRIANVSRTIAFAASLKILSLLEVPYFREGWRIQLHNSTLVVTTGCSGIRYLLSYFVFSLAYAYMTRDTFKKGLLVVAMVLPLSICASTMRLTAIFVMVHYISPFWGQSRPHILISWINFGVFLFGAIALDQWLLNRRESLNARKLGR